MEWRPMSEHVFPWREKHLFAVCFAKDDENDVDIFRVEVGDLGEMYFRNGGFLSVNERGWIPFAWRVDDAPVRDDELFPPMWTDYLTEVE